jgi:hypothetical protein
MGGTSEKPGQNRADSEDPNAQQESKKEGGAIGPQCHVYHFYFRIVIRIASFDRGDHLTLQIRRPTEWVISLA